MKDGLFHIVFVCTGNICRSPMAEGILRARLSPRSAEFASVSSAGVAAPPGMPASLNSVRACHRHGIDITGHRSSLVTRDLVTSADLILVMEDHHREALVDSWPQAAGRTCLLSEYASNGSGEPARGVPDPIGQDVDVYARVFDAIEQYVARALPRIESSIAAATRNE